MEGCIQNGHKPKRPHDSGEQVNQYLSLNKLGIIKSRSETMPEVGFKQNALYYRYLCHLVPT